MPVDARLTGISLGLTLGFASMTFKTGNEDFKRTILDLFGLDNKMPRKKQWIIMILFGALLALPLILDGSIQMATGYESFNLLRTFTGLVFGFELAVFFSSIILSATTYPKEG